MVCCIKKKLSNCEIPMLCRTDQWSFFVSSALSWRGHCNGCTPGWGTAGLRGADDLGWKSIPDQRPLPQTLPVCRVQPLHFRQPGRAGPAHECRAFAPRGGVESGGGRLAPVQAVPLHHAAQGQLSAALQDWQACPEVSAGGTHQGGWQGQWVAPQVRGHWQPCAPQMQCMRLLYQQPGKTEDAHGQLPPWGQSQAVQGECLW